MKEYFGIFLCFVEFAFLFLSKARAGHPLGPVPMTPVKSLLAAENSFGR
jgi:hypothetical protein